VLRAHRPASSLSPYAPLFRSQERRAIRPYPSLEAPVDRVVLDAVGEVIGGNEIVGRHYLHVVTQARCAQRRATDAPEPVDADSDHVETSFRPGANPERCRPAFRRRTAAWN